ncbi:hypothetical protein L484_010288 [Morus notabilis]|uniref:Uncharacterized protein n=1 Tax=Morus notabilis TaxID=981085 RepID=W9QVI8_9ROSA|nr:hypothetical protein L484_010288 [Morus notabilis]
MSPRLTASHDELHLLHRVNSSDTVFWIGSPRQLHLSQRYGDVLIEGDRGD